MININDYNREDLIASCLMEAAEVMSESSGNNGKYSRLMREKYKAEKARNDANRVPDDKRYYEKGYNESSKYNYNNIHEHDSDSINDRRSRLENSDKWFKENHLKAHYAAHPNMKKNKMSDKDRELHEKINKRAMNESIDLANTILDLLDED